MFESKYSRKKFWIISICLLIPTTIINLIAKAMENVGQDNNAIFLYIVIFVLSLVWINNLANRIRDYGHNPWISLFALIPFINIGLSLYYGIANKKNQPVQENDSINSDKTSFTKAVINHSKDIVNEIKPVLNEYNEKHSFSNDNIEPISNTVLKNDFEIDENKIYEQIMIEIEENNKVKSTWAKALAQSDGDDKKANSLYIRIRVKEIKIEIENLQKQKELEFLELKEKERKKKISNIIETKQLTSVIDKIEDIENYGYSFLSKNILRKNNSWDDLDLVYDEELEMYFVKKNNEIFDSFHIVNIKN